ncbi:MAG: sugar ABC transporter substrate-binding protein [Oscillospiraceae bacterium]|jgi:ribose transport system substrate-binding protein|nr:sugar ABC transporter substrate-binding protein [Oscillospiraceae bacterium]
MRKFKKVLALTLALVMMIAVMAGCKAKVEDEPSDPVPPPANGDVNPGAPAAPPAMVGKDIFTENIKIAYITLAMAGIGNRMHELAFAQQSAFYPNLDFQFFDGNYDPNNQRAQIGECINAGYDAIMIECMDTNVAGPAILEAEAAGIPVITVNQGADVLHTLHIQGSDYAAGAQAARLLAAEIGGKGNAVLLDVPAEQKASGRMGTGFEETLAKEFPDIKLIETQPIANWNQENANNAMRDILTKHPNAGDISIVYGVSDDVAVGAVQAIESAGRQNEGILVYGNMGYPNGLQAVKDGRMFGTGLSDIYLEDTSSLTFALFFIATGTTSITAGYTETPTVDMVVSPASPANIDLIIAASHWLEIPGAIS